MEEHESTEAKPIIINPQAKVSHIVHDIKEVNRSTLPKYSMVHFAKLEHGK